MASLCNVWLPYSSPEVLIQSLARRPPPSCTRRHSNHKCKAQDKAARATPCFVVQAQRFIAPGLLAMAQVMAQCPRLLTTYHGPGNGPLSTAPDYWPCSVVNAPDSHGRQQSTVLCHLCLASFWPRCPYSNALLCCQRQALH